MIGIIISGHGKYGSGMYSSLKFIAGKQEYVEVIDFDDDNLLLLENRFNNAFNDYKCLDGILVFCDLVGGTPFKTAVLLSDENEKIKVIGGCNIAMLLEVIIARKYSTINELSESIVNTGKEQIVCFSLNK